MMFRPTHPFVYFRTLVVPTFFTHKPQPSLVKMGKGVIPAYQRIDANRIRRFVSSVSVENLRKACGESFDVAFEVNIYRVKFVKKMCITFQLTLIRVNSISPTTTMLVTKIVSVFKSKHNSLSPLFFKHFIYSLACWLQWHVGEFSAGATKNKPKMFPSSFTKVKVEYYARSQKIQSQDTVALSFIPRQFKTRKCSNTLHLHTTMDCKIWNWKVNNLEVETHIRNKVRLWSLCKNRVKKQCKNNEITSW